MKPRQRGFTLMELMIALAIVGILASIAYPSYQNSVRKSRRAAAQAFLMEVAQRQQQFLLDNRAYAATVDDLSLAAPDEVSPYYTIDVTADAGPPPTFMITATPVTGTSQVADGDLSIDQTGNRLPADRW